MSVIGLKELKFERESELEAILTENPSVIEEGLSVIDTQVITNSGRLDILGLDSGKVLVVIELKIEASDEMLWQTLDYYDWVFRNIDTVKRLYAGSDIDYSQTPRLMLIAPGFSEVIKEIREKIMEEIPEPKKRRKKKERKKKEKEESDQGN